MEPTEIISGLFATIVGGIIVALITEKVAINHKMTTITTNNREYISPYASGCFVFDYSNNNGKYTIGKDDKSFTTQWSKASDTSIHAYNDTCNVDSIALIKDSDLKSLSFIDADFSSRSRSPKINEIIIWKNTKGHYAATKIVKIKDDRRGSSADELECEVIY